MKRMTRAEASSAWLAPLPFNSFVSAAVAIKFRSNELADKLAEWGLYLDVRDPNLPYGVEKARPMMREIAKRGRQPDPQPLGAAGVPPPRGGGTPPSNPPTLSPSEQTASGDG